MVQTSTATGRFKHKADDHGTTTAPVSSAHTRLLLPVFLEARIPGSPSVEEPKWESFRGFYLCGIDKESKHTLITSFLACSSLKVVLLGKTYVLYHRP